MLTLLLSTPIDDACADFLAAIRGVTDAANGERLPEAQATLFTARSVLVALLSRAPSRRHNYGERVFFLDSTGDIHTYLRAV